MGRAILAETDRIVRVNVDDVSIHNTCKSDRRPHVVGEDEERRAVWYDATGEGHSVHDGPHPVLANSEMEIPTGIILGGKTGLPLDDRVRRARQVRRTADQLGDFAGDGVDDDARG